MHKTRILPNVGNMTLLPNPGNPGFIEWAYPDGNIMPTLFFSSVDFYKKKYFRNIFRVSNSLYPDEVRRFVNPDLYLNHLQTAPGIRRQRVNIYFAVLGTHKECLSKVILTYSYICLIVAYRELLQGLFSG